MNAISSLRERRGMTQQEVADRLDVPLEEYRRAEERPDEMTLDQARLVCRVLGCGLDVFVRGSVR